MSKKSFFLIGILSSALLVGCQPNPTLINSTQHQGDKPKANSEHSANSNNNAKHDESTSKMGEPMNHSEMNHTGMQSAPNAAAQPYDLQFLDTMIHHHESAVEMAKTVAAKGSNAEIKAIAAKMTADQEKETAQMKQWREAWFAGKTSAMNMEMTGMKDSMKGMDSAKLNAASGAAFDLEFINQMIPHHEGAVVMAREAATKAEHAELKTLASQIIKAQEAEIKQMQDWKAKMPK